MPLDPMIARGVEVPDVRNSLIASEELLNRRQSNQLMADRLAQSDQSAQADAAKAQEEQELRMLYPAVKAGDPRAVQYVVGKIAAKNPQLGELYTQNPAQLAAALEQGLGIQPEEAPAPPAPIDEQRLPSGRYLATQGGKPVGSPWAPPPPPVSRAPSAGPAPGGEPAAPTGKPPTGYRWTADGNLEPIPGGPAGIKQDLVETKRRTKAAQLAQQGANIAQSITDAKALVGWKTSGFVGGNLAESEKLGKGSQARALREALTTIKANIGFDRLQAMREASPTGGALGQVAVQELVALQASIASLDQGLPAETLLKNLERVERHYQSWLNILNAAANEDGEAEAPAAPAAAPAAPAVGLTPEEKAELDALRKQFGR